MLMVETKIDQQFINQNLCVAAACTFTDIDALSICGNQGHDVIRNQTVVNNHLRTRDQTRCLDGEQIWVTRSSTNEIHGHAFSLASSTVARVSVPSWVTCNPHSVLSVPVQRPERASPSTDAGCVHGQQPIEE